MYGVHRYGENAPMYGHQHSEETRRKMRENHADQSGEKNPRYGYHYTEEEKRKSSIAHSKLTENQVLEIVELRKQGFQYKELAERFGVNDTIISRICNGKTFSSITGIQLKKKMNIPRSKFTKPQVLKILELRKQGFQYKELAEKFGVSKQTISNICCGKRYSLITGIKYGE